MDDIRSIRQELGLTQAGLADALGLNQSTVSRFERGELALDKRTLLAAQALLAKHGCAPTEENRTHGADSAIDDDLPDHDVLVLPPLHGASDSGAAGEASTGQADELSGERERAA